MLTKRSIEKTQVSHNTFHATSLLSLAPLMCSVLMRHFPFSFVVSIFRFQHSFCLCFVPCPLASVLVILCVIPLYILKQQFVGLLIPIAEKMSVLILCCKWPNHHVVKDRFRIKTFICFFSSLSNFLMF